MENRLFFICFIFSFLLGVFVLTLFFVKFAFFQQCVLYKQDGQFYLFTNHKVHQHIVDKKVKKIRTTINYQDIYFNLFFNKKNEEDWIYNLKNLNHNVEIIEGQNYLNFEFGKVNFFEMFII